MMVQKMLKIIKIFLISFILNDVAYASGGEKIKDIEIIDDGNLSCEKQGRYSKYISYIKWLESFYFLTGF